MCLGSRGRSQSQPMSQMEDLNQVGVLGSSGFSENKGLGGVLSLRNALTERAWKDAVQVLGTRQGSALLLVRDRRQALESKS